MEWLNEPTIWKIDGDRIIVTSDPKTDFWCRTHSSRILDNGHFLFQTVKGDFKTEVRVAGEFNTLYDQAGLMMRLDAMHWIKCGIELANGIRNVSAVVTREWSDWSIIALPDTEAVWFRVIRSGPTVEMYYSMDGKIYIMYRQAYLTDDPDMHVGVMAASPGGSGFTASFEGYKLALG